MARDFLVALDAGTGSGRCAVFDTSGTLVASAQVAPASVETCRFPAPEVP